MGLLKMNCAWATLLMLSALATQAEATRAWRWAPNSSSLMGVDKEPPKTLLKCNGSKAGHPSDIQCPESCPYLRADALRMCTFVCVAAEHCADENPLSSFADPVSMRCEGCHAAACITCKTSRTCAECQKGFVLSDEGLCQSRVITSWYASFCVIGALASIVLWYLVMLPFRKVINEGALLKGLLFRESSKVCDRDTFQPFDMWIDLGKHMNAGIGLMLHFRWQQVVMVWSFFMVLILVILQCFFNTRPSAIKHDPGAPEAFKACELDLHLQEDNFVFMEQVYFFAALLIYIFSTVGCIVFAVHQRRTSRGASDKEITMGDYALLAKGLPQRPGAVDVEGEIQAFFEQSFPDKSIVGVSVCWDFHDSSAKDWVKDMNEADLRTLDIRFEMQRTSAGNRSFDKEPDDLDGTKSGRRCDYQLQCLDCIFGIGPHLLEADQTEGIEEKLQEISCSGCAYIVFKTERECKDALEQSRHTPLTFQGERIELEQQGVEPETVLWDNFGTSGFTCFRNCVLGIICIIISVILLDIFFYAPYVVYIQTYSGVKGKVGGDMIQGTLLGLLITVCNQIIYQLIGVISEMCGFQRYSKKLNFYVVSYTFAVLFNTCLDLWTVMLLAQGMSEEEVVGELADSAKSTMGDANAVPRDILTAKSIAEHPGVQRSVYTQLLLYLFPGCLLIPFLLEPLVTNFLTYWLPLWLVRSRKEVNPFEAEQRLAAVPYDLSRYGDILVNIMLCVLALFFTYRDVYMVFLYMLVSLLVIYAWDHFRYLRCSQRCYFASASLDSTTHYLLAVPCGIMAASMVFRAWAASDEGFLEEFHGTWQETVKQHPYGHIAVVSRETIFRNLCTAFVVHLLAHFLLLHHLVPRLGEIGEDHDQDVPYDKTAQHTPCNWFTANPVHCMRSKYFFKHEPPCTFSMVGKEYLMQPNPSIGLFYKPAREDIMHSLEGRASSLLADPALAKFFTVTPAASPGSGSVK